MSETTKCAKCGLTAGSVCRSPQYCPHPNAVVPAAPTPPDPASLTGRQVGDAIQVSPREVVRDGPMRVECWWSEEDNAWLARLTDDEPETRPFTSTHTSHGETREEALAHLAIAEYVTALAVAVPFAASAGEGREALRSAVAAIYFGDNSDYLSALWSVVRHFDPRIAALLESDEQAAYDEVTLGVSAAPAPVSREGLKECPSGLCDGSGLLSWEEYGATKTALCQACRLKASRYPVEKVAAAIYALAEKHIAKVPNRYERERFDFAFNAGLNTDAIALAQQILAAAPVREVTDAMCLAAMREFSAQKGESHDALWGQLDAKMQAEVLDEWRHILTTALTRDGGK